MKKYLIFLLLHLIFLPSVINAQWYTQYISPGNWIMDVRFINRYTGWACGDNLILKTTNGGTNWYPQNGHGFLFQIHPVNDSVVYACGDYIILKTIDGGSTWITVREGAALVPELYGLWFNNENTGWFCGDRAVMKTTDGGYTLIDSMFMTNTCNDIHFKNDSFGVIAANSKAFRTANSGTSWNPVVVPSLWESPFMQKISFVGNTGWTVTLGRTVFKTTNYGISWDSVTNIPFGEGYNARCIEFSSLLVGYSGGDAGKIFKTTDGGNTWKINFQFGGPFTSIYAFSDSIVWVVGGIGSRYIMNTLNGGLVNVKEIGLEPFSYFLKQNYPNPFNSSTVIEFSISNDMFVSLKINNILGKEIKTILNKKFKKGEYSEIFNADGLNSGVYFYTLKLYDSRENKIYSETKKFLILK